MANAVIFATAITDTRAQVTDELLLVFLKPMSPFKLAKQYSPPTFRLARILREA